MRAVNLIPLDQRGGVAPSAGRSQGGAYAVLGLLGGLALLAVLYGIAHHKIPSRQAEAVALEAQVQEAQSNAAKLGPYASFMGMREQRMNAVAQLVDSRFDWAHAFHELGRVLPSNVSITSLSGTIGSPGALATSSSAGATSGGAVASATPPGSVPSFTLGGCATSQSTVALALDRLRLIDGVSTVTLQSSTKSAGGGTSTGAGSCPGADPAFTVQIAFDPLPATPASSSAAVAAPTSSPSGSSAAKSSGTHGGA
jgi:Tfp pilus assembly protein PilN